MRICIVSPHLDDAVLSCGVRMQRVARGGGDVTVLNIFTAGTNAANRRVEEENAARTIGARPFFLDELDAPDRDARYLSDIALFHGDMADVPEELIDRVASRIADFLAREPADEVYFPLGAGTHIDHRIAFAAAARLSHPHIRFYEDRPYILWPGMLQARLNGIGCKTGVQPVTAEDMMRDIGAYHYLTHFVPPGAFRDTCLPRYFAGLAPPASYAWQGTDDALAATPEELEKLADSLFCYTSQMPLIYRDRETFLRDSLRHEESRSGRAAYLERSWKLEKI